MLEKLESIAWDSIQPFFGKGSDIPKLILELTSSNPNTYSKSLNILYEELFHQETVEQRIGLEAISNSKHFWDGFSDDCIDSRVAGVMKRFGLPIRPEDLTKFLIDKIAIKDIISQDPIYSLNFF